MGTTTAYHLTRSKLFDPQIHSITLLEAAGIAAGSSGKGGGFIASWATPKCIAPLSFALHENLAKEYGGAELWGYRKVYAADVQLQARRDIAADQADSGDRPQSLNWLLPGAVRSYDEIGTPKDSGQVHPYLFTNKIADLARESGVDIITGHATSINYNNDKSQVRSVTYVSKEETKELEATDILIAAGPWTSKLLPQIRLLAPKGHSIAIMPLAEHLSPHILFPKIHSSKPVLSPDMYPRPRDPINAFETIYASGPDRYNVPLPELVTDVTLEDDEIEDLWRAVSSVSQEISDGEVVTNQACHKAQIRKHEENEEVGPIVGPLDVQGLWVATGLDEWGVSNGPAVGLIMSEMILEGKAKSADVESLDPKHWI